MNLNGNTILLTGGTSGIGFALLHKFYSLDNKLIVVGRNEPKLKEIERDFNGARTIHCNLADTSSVLRLIKICKHNHPDINILINTAGVQHNYIFGKDEPDFDNIQNEITVNLISPLQLCFAFIPLLQKHIESAIINVSSGLAFAPKASAPVYCGTKAAIHILTKALRYQLEQSNVKVFEIIPPLVDTPMTAGRGKGKISPEQLVDEFIVNLAKDKFESNIGKTKYLRILQRLSPLLADNILKSY